MVPNETRSASDSGAVLRPDSDLLEVGTVTDTTPALAGTGAGVPVAVVREGAGVRPEPLADTVAGVPVAVVREVAGVRPEPLAGAAAGIGVGWRGRDGLAVAGGLAAAGAGLEARSSGCRPRGISFTLAWSTSVGCEWIPAAGWSGAAGFGPEPAFSSGSTPIPFMVVPAM